MSWLCGICETENADFHKFCEVCEAPKVDTIIHSKHSETYPPRSLVSVSSKPRLDSPKRSGYFSISSHKSSTPTSFWSTAIIVAFLGGIVGGIGANWAYTNFWEVLVGNTVYATIPLLAYLLTKRISSAFFSQTLFSNSVAVVGAYWDTSVFWFSLVSVLPIILIFNQIKTSQISIGTILLASLMSNLAAGLYATVIWGSRLSFADWLSFFIIPSILAAPVSIIATRILKRG